MNRNACFSFLFYLFVASLFGNITSAQAQGWQWGTGSTKGMCDGGPVTTDTFGNVFMSAIYESDSICFGTTTLYNTTSTNPQLVVVKADEAGSFLWAISSTNSNVNTEDENIATDRTGNVYVLAQYCSPYFEFGGITLSNPSLFDMFVVIKISPAGTVLWAQNIGCLTGSGGAFENPNGSLGVDTMANVYVTGTFNLPFTIGSFALTSSSGSAFLIKLNTSGTPIWAINYGSTSIKPGVLSVTPGGNIYSCGIFYSPTITIGGTTLHNTSVNGIYLAKWDTYGNPLWAERIDSNIYSVNYSALDEHENIYLTGAFRNTMNVGVSTFTSYAGTSDAFIAKYDSSGNAKWGKGVGSYGQDKGFCVAADKCGKLFFYGAMYILESLGGSPPGYSVSFGTATLEGLSDGVPDMFIAEYDTSGNYIFSIASPWNDWDGNSGFALDNKGNFFVGGPYRGIPYVFGPDTLHPDSVNSNLYFAKFTYDSFQCNQYCIPTPINGGSYLCVGASKTLGNATPGCTWSSSNPAIAIIGSASGIVTGMSTGAVTITCYMPCGRIVTVTMNVISSIPPITGTLHDCEDFFDDTLNDLIAYGRWSSSNPAVAAIDSISGIINPLSAGTSVITYTIGGACFTTVTFTVNPIPDSITGAEAICTGATTTLTGYPAGGIWSSSYVPDATVGSSSGIVTGIAPGIPVIYYTFPTGCYIFEEFTVNPIPTISGTGDLCAGSVTSLTGTPGYGVWASSNPAIATIGSSSGFVYAAATGTTLMTYTVPGGCYDTVTFDVITTPSPIIAPEGGNLCYLSTTGFTDAMAGGSWSSSNTSVATADYYTGFVTAVALGTAVITYTLGPGCYVTINITVNPIPDPVSGASHVCVGDNITLTDPTTGGTWSTTGTHASIGSTTGIVTGISGGTENITYSLSDGCFASYYISVVTTPCPSLGITSLFNEVSIAPNPANNELLITADNSIYQSLVITNQVGQEMIQQPIISSLTNVDLKHLSPGLYYIILNGSNGKLVHKFVKL